MYKTTFNNIQADNLIVEFPCSCGHKIETAKIAVPELECNLSNAILTTKCQCAHCGKDYVISTKNQLLDGILTIDKVDSDCNDVQVYEIPYPSYGPETISLDTYESIIRLKEIVQEIDSLNNESKQYLYLLLHSNVVSIIDAFIKIKTLPIIIEDDLLIDRVIQENLLGCKRQFEKAKSKSDKILILKKRYSHTSFQSHSKRKKLFEKILGIKIESVDGMDSPIRIRNIIVHRNSIDEKGFKHRISRDMLLKLIDSADEYITSIDKALLEYQAETYAKRILNR